MKGKYLITTDGWFFAPNGKQYKAVWGDVQVMDDTTIVGIKTNARSTNWYVKVGSEENFMCVAGCQIHYFIKCDEMPKPIKHNNPSEAVVDEERKEEDCIYIPELNY